MTGDRSFPLPDKYLRATRDFDLHGVRMTPEKKGGGPMTAKKTYSVRLDGDQRAELEARAERGRTTVGHLVRLAIAGYLREQGEVDYLAEVEARVAATINRLARQVEKDRAEQQLIAGMLDDLREWLFFTLPKPPDVAAAKGLRDERNVAFYERLPLRFENRSRSKIATYMATLQDGGPACPVCSVGTLHRKQGSKGIFWYCSNRSAEFRCEATFSDEAGTPSLDIVKSQNPTRA